MPDNTNKYCHYNINEMGNTVLVGLCWPKDEYNWDKMLKCSGDRTGGDGGGAQASTTSPICCWPCCWFCCCCFAPCCCSSGQICHRSQGLYYSIDTVRLNLSAGEIKRLKKIWDDLKKVHENQVAQRLFSLIFTKCPEIKCAFNLSHLSNEDAIKDARMLHHCLIFQDTFEMILTSLGVENDHVNSLLIAFGSQHSFYTRRKFDPSYWRYFGESFAELFDDLPAPGYRKRQEKQLWVKTIFFILASMKSGYQIGAANKTMTVGSRRWWEEVRWKKKTNLESKLLEVLFVTDPVEPNS